MSEADEQRTVVEWCEWAPIPVYHVPNEAKRSPQTAAKLKALGMRAGVPDLCIPVAASGYHGLYIEMKYGRNKPADAQWKWLGLLDSNGYMVAVCYSSEDAIDLIKRYARGELKRGQQLVGGNTMRHAPRPKA